MYYDNFENVYCLPSEEDLGIAPPERYLRTIRNPSEYYTEHWEVSGTSKGNRLDVCYSDPKYANSERFRLAKLNDCSLSYIRWWEIPASKFDEYAKRFGLMKETDNE